MKLKAVLVLFILLVCNILVAKAQADANPCDPDDGPNCPLDTWVFILVGGALVLASVQLYRKQKAQSRVA